MKISEVEVITGLTSKAIRLYEEKGLVFPARCCNGYREYDAEALNRLKQIKLLRDLGISISEIELYFGGAASLKEVISRHKIRLENESSANREKYLHCEELLCKFDSEKKTDITSVCAINSNSAILGIDVGTTTLSASVVDIESNTVLEAYTVTGAERMPSDSDLFEYNIESLAEKALRVLRYLTAAYPNIRAVGLTGQMHGIIYLDKEGRAVSPLYNWQDGRGERKTENGKTYCEQIYGITGKRAYTGYGFATLYYNKINGTEPENAFTFCTAADYLALKLTGEKFPIVHPTNAASFGLFDLSGNCFDVEAVEKIGLSHLQLPKLANDGEVIGFFNDIPVFSAIGDNQASFFGTVKNVRDSVLVNFGTGSQISAVVDAPVCDFEDLEIRPYFFGNYLLCGSALCGGRAYAVLESFFSQYAGLLGIGGESQYENMNLLARRAYDSGNFLKVSTRFCGTRRNPELRGSVSDIDIKSFTPEALILGTLHGMAEELRGYFDMMHLYGISELVASGNAVQKNSVLRAVLSDVFGCEVSLTDTPEEAALGAALYAGICSGTLKKEKIREIIKYK